MAKHAPGATIRFRVGLWIGPNGEKEQTGEIVSVHRDEEHKRNYYRVCVQVEGGSIKKTVLEHEIIEA